jgi:hypothetical protein
MKTVACGTHWEIKEGRRYWNIWMGNPFCIGLHRVGKDMDLAELIPLVKKDMKREERRFKKQFPDTPWGHAK